MELAGIFAEAEKLKGENNNLMEMVKKSEDKIKKSEEMKEHWKLEYQLLEMKYEKAKKDIGDKAETELESCDKEEVEKEIYKERISELIQDKLKADSKAMAFYLECQNLEKRVKSVLIKKSEMESELFSSKESVDKVREEMNTTVLNYEMQLSMMSEHLAGMNEKLTTRTDEINTLKYKLENKKSKSKK